MYNNLKPTEIISKILGNFCFNSVEELDVASKTLENVYTCNIGLVISRNDTIEQAIEDMTSILKSELKYNSNKYPSIKEDKEELKSNIKTLTDITLKLYNINSLVKQNKLLEIIKRNLFDYIDEYLDESMIKADTGSINRMANRQQFKSLRNLPLYNLNFDINYIIENSIDDFIEEVMTLSDDFSIHCSNCGTVIVPDSPHYHEYYYNDNEDVDIPKDLVFCSSSCVYDYIIDEII